MLNREKRREEDWGSGYSFAPSVDRLAGYSLEVAAALAPHNDIGTRISFVLAMASSYSRDL